MNSTFRESFLELLDKYSNYTDMLERENSVLKDINAKLQSDLLEKNELVKSNRNEQ